MYDDTFVRNIFRGQIRDVLKKDSRFKEFDYREKIANLMERGCNNQAIRRSKKDHVSPINWNNEEFRHIYSAVFYRIIENLDPKSQVGSSHLIDSIHSGLIKPEEAAYLSSVALCPEIWKHIVKELHKRINEKIKAKTTTQYKCPNCQKRKATYRLVQLRSLDEGYNTSLTCDNCSYHWIR